MLGGYPYFRVDALNNDPSLRLGQRSALLDEMLGANAATRALMMPEQVDSAEMRAVQRRLGWLPATLNVAANQAKSVAPLFRDDLLGCRCGSFSRWCRRWIGCRFPSGSRAATG